MEARGEPQHRTKVNIRKAGLPGQACLPTQRPISNRGRTVVEVACLGNPDPVGMKVYAPAGEETFDDIQTTEEAQAGADRREAA